MTESVELNTLVLLSIAIINLGAGFLTWKAHRAIMVVERATNSMKDALVAATAKASYAEGHDAAQLVGAERATELASAVAEAARVLATLGAEKDSELARTTDRRDTIDKRNKLYPPDTEI